MSQYFHSATAPPPPPTPKHNIIDFTTENISGRVGHAQCDPRCAKCWYFSNNGLETFQDNKTDVNNT